MDNLFSVSAALSRVLCSDIRSSICEGGSLLFAVWGKRSASSLQLGMDVLVVACSSISWSTSEGVLGLGGWGAATDVVGDPHLLLGLEGVGSLLWGGVRPSIRAHCHAPNRFGTVNMEDNINIK